jgi:hypothetical protein
LVEREIKGACGLEDLSKFCDEQISDVNNGRSRIVNLDQGASTIRNFLLRKGGGVPLGRVNKSFIPTFGSRV